MPICVYANRSFVQQQVVKSFADSANNNKKITNTLIITSVRNSFTVPTSQIVRIKAASAYSRIYFVNGNKILTARVLYWFKDMLLEDMFVSTQEPFGK